MINWIKMKIILKKLLPITIEIIGIPEKSSVQLINNGEHKVTQSRISMASEESSFIFETYEIGRMTVDVINIDYYRSSVSMDVNANITYKIIMMAEQNYEAPGT